MTLKIAIDGRCLTDHFPGIGRYLFNLLRSMPAVARDVELNLFVSEEEPNSRFELERLSKLGIQLIPTSSSVRSLGQQFELPRQLRQLGADVFHAPYFATAYRVPCPLVVGLYDTIASRFPEVVPSTRARLAVGVGTRLAARSARFVITLSRFAKNDLVETYQIPADRVVVTPGAPPEDFQPATDEDMAELQQRLGLPERFALHVGTNKPHKNLERLLNAWAELQRSADADCGLVLAGAHDPQHLDTAALADQLQLMGFRQLGPVAERDMAALYSSARLLVVPSLYEGFGLPVLESMACGTPVACSKASSLPEVAGHAAVYFDPEDSGSIVQSLQRLFKNPGYRRMLGERGRQRTAQLSWKQAARLTLDAYRRAASDD
ncbi:MAG: glycosyltransferase family 1 protein [Acidobacteriota bacterium]